MKQLFTNKTTLNNNNEFKLDDTMQCRTGKQF